MWNILMAIETICVKIIEKQDGEENLGCKTRMQRPLLHLALSD